MKQSPSLHRTRIIIVSVLLGLGMIGLAILLIFVFGANVPFSASVPATQTAQIPTIFAHTPDCDSSSLLLGTSTFQTQTLKPAADGGFNVPADTSGVAYWLEGTETNPVFVLSPTPENLAIMATISVGSNAKVIWANCNSATYTLSSAEARAFDGSALAGQTVEGVTLFFETNTTGAGFVFQGELTEQQISTINTPSLSDVQAEISLLETTAAPDGSSIRVGVSIQNYGTLPITLSASDVSLLQMDSTPLVMTGSEPLLPKQIAPGTTETLYFAFPRPASPTATLKILTIEYEIEGY